MENNLSAWETPMAARHPLIQWAAENGMMLKSVCSDIGISRPTLHHWDKGHCMPSPELVQKVRVLTNHEVTPNMIHDHWLAMQERKAA